MTGIAFTNILSQMFFYKTVKYFFEGCHRLRYSSHDFSKRQLMFCRCDWLQLILGDTRGKRKHLGTDHHFLQFPSQWPNHCRSTGENDKLSADNCLFKGCSDCAKKCCSNPSPTRGSSRGVAFSLFYICVRIYSLSRLILSSRWLTTVEQKTQSLTPESSKTHLLVSLISRNTHLTPRLTH